MDRYSLNFKNKTCFISGASSGIGRATALAFAKKGANIACIDINQDLGDETVHQIKNMDAKAIFIKCDVSKSDQVKSAVEETVKTFGSVDIAFNNAGIEGMQAATANASEENWNRVIDINLKGTWLSMKYQIPFMLKQGNGSIVNCSSIAGLIGFQNIPAYVASKHGVIGLTQAAALEYAKNNIRINAVCPGVIQTAMIDRFVQGNEAAKAQLAMGEPVGRIGDPEEIASAVLWLSSDGASFVTGHALAVDGGWVAQ